MKALVSLVAVSSLLTSDLASAQNLDEKKKAVVIIVSAANDLCKTVETHGSVTSADVQGDVHAQLNTLLKHLADAGIKGAGQLKTEEYESVVRQDLTVALRDSQTCKLRVLEDLEDRIFTKNPSESTPPEEKKSTALRGGIASKVGDWVGTVRCRDGRLIPIKFEADTLHGNAITGRYHFDYNGPHLTGATLSPDPTSDDRSAYVLVPEGSDTLKYDLVAVGDTTLRGHSTGPEACRIVLER